MESHLIRGSRISSVQPHFGLFVFGRRLLNVLIYGSLCAFQTLIPDYLAFIPNNFSPDSPLGQFKDNRPLEVATIEFLTFISNGHVLQASNSMQLT